MSNTTKYFTAPAEDSFVSRYGFRPASRKGKVNLLLGSLRNLYASRSGGKVAPVVIDRDTVDTLEPLQGLSPCEVDWVANHASFEASEVHGKAARGDKRLSTALVRVAGTYRAAAVVVFGRNS